MCSVPAGTNKSNSLLKMGKIYQVKVFGISGEMKMIDLCSTEEEMQKMTVRELKLKIEKRFLESAGHGTEMVFTNVRLDNDASLLSEYGIQHLSVILLLVKVPGGVVV